MKIKINAPNRKRLITLSKSVIFTPVFDSYNAENTPRTGSGVKWFSADVFDLTNVTSRVRTEDMSQNSVIIEMATAIERDNADLVGDIQERGIWTNPQRIDLLAAGLFYLKGIIDEFNSTVGAYANENTTSPIHACSFFDLFSKTESRQIDNSFIFPTRTTLRATGARNILAIAGIIELAFVRSLLTIGTCIQYNNGSTLDGSGIINEINSTFLSMPSWSREKTSKPGLVDTALNTLLTSVANNLQVVFPKAEKGGEVVVSSASLMEWITYCVQTLNSATSGTISQISKIIAEETDVNGSNSDLTTYIVEELRATSTILVDNLQRVNVLKFAYLVIMSKRHSMFRPFGFFLKSPAINGSRVSFGSDHLAKILGGRKLSEDFNASFHLFIDLDIIRENIVKSVVKAISNPLDALERIAFNAVGLSVSGRNHEVDKISDSMSSAFRNSLDQTRFLLGVKIPFDISTSIKGLGLESSLSSLHSEVKSSYCHVTFKGRGITVQIIRTVDLLLYLRCFYQFTTGSTVLPDGVADTLGESFMCAVITNGGETRGVHYSFSFIKKGGFVVIPLVYSNDDLPGYKTNEPGSYELSHPVVDLRKVFWSVPDDQKFALYQTMVTLASGGLVEAEGALSIDEFKNVMKIFEPSMPYVTTREWNEEEVKLFFSFLSNEYIKSRSELKMSQARMHQRVLPTLTSLSSLLFKDNND